MLSKQGFVVSFKDDTGEDREETFQQREFEKRFFADATNQLMCKTFLEHALRDSVSGEIGKSIIFAVSQNHAAKLAQILNLMADRMFPGKYQSNFAVQVTSQIPLPPLATQQAIVAEIEAEQALVTANRELIARFEKKIQATLARVWGENLNAV